MPYGVVNQRLKKSPVPCECAKATTRNQSTKGVGGRQTRGEGQRGKTTKREQMAQREGK